MKKPKTKLDPATLPFASIPELAAALRDHTISAKELTKFFTERVEALGPQYNARACSLAKPAKAAAKDVDDDMKRDRFRGPLQRIPCGLKDLLSVADFPTTRGEPTTDACPYLSANRLMVETGNDHALG